MTDNQDIKAYETLESKFEPIGASGIAGISIKLKWEAKHIIPEEGQRANEDQIAALAVIRHNMLANQEMSDLLDEAETNRSHLDDNQSRNLDLMRQKWVHENPIDADLVGRMAKKAMQCHRVWLDAKKANDFQTYEPIQQELLELARENAIAVADTLDNATTPYDACLDKYDVNRRCSHLDPIFETMGDFLPDFIAEATEKQKSKPVLLLDDVIPKEQQLAAMIALYRKAGNDFTDLRIDIGSTASHTGILGDSRITTRFEEDRFLRIYNSTNHENGHYRYTQGTLSDQSGQPIGEPLGLSIHESQSLFFEKRIGHSREFLEFAVPILRDELGKSGPKWDVENIHRLVNRINPGPLRIGADAVTLHAHITLRYEIGKALINGEIDVKDIPDIWNDRIGELLLGVQPTDFKTGCMQDTHWAKNLFGYFTTYALGDIASIQFHEQMMQDVPDVMTDIANGDFQALDDWQSENIFKHASKLTADELLTQVTGRAFDPESAKTYYSDKHLQPALYRPPSPSSRLGR